MQASTGLLVGRRALEGIDGYCLINDLAWHSKLGRWFLRCHLTIQNSIAESVPSKTGWCVVVDSRYPLGSIDIFPDGERGITSTFPHQLYNGPPKDCLPWRTGKICVSPQGRTFGLDSETQEPHDAQSRLAWHVNQALVWLECATRNTLRVADDPYELPDFPETSKLRFAFSEDFSTLKTWTRAELRSGLAELIQFKSSNTRTLVAKRFLSNRKEQVLNVRWGKAIESDSSPLAGRALWVLLNSAPVVDNWQVPITFGELRKSLELQGLSFNDLILPLCNHIRDQRTHLLLVGFPLPSVVGGAPAQLHWQALELLPLTKSIRHGFRNNEIGWRQTDCRSTFAPRKGIAWVPSENWSETRSHARGQFAEELLNRKVLLIGAGSLGSVIAEMLIRGGVRRLVICDGEVFEHGNLARHTLTMIDEGTNKASSLSDRLNSLSAHTDIYGIDASFPSFNEAQMSEVSDCEIVLDCTAEEETLSAIEEHNWLANAYAVHLAFGWYVRRLYVVGVPCSEFRRDAVTELLRPYILEDTGRTEDGELPREGPGCWHPVFPGRVDDVMMMAAMGVKEIERLAKQPDGGFRGAVFSWTRGDDFNGVERQGIP